MHGFSRESTDHFTDCKPHEDRTEEADEACAQLPPECIVLTQLCDELILHLAMILQITSVIVDHDLNIFIDIELTLLRLLLLLRLRILSFAEHDEVEGDIQSLSDLREGLDARISGATINDVVDRVLRYSRFVIQIFDSELECLFPGFDTLTNSFTIHFVIPFNINLLHHVESAYCLYKVCEIIST